MFVEIPQYDTIFIILCIVVFNSPSSHYSKWSAISKVVLAKYLFHMLLFSSIIDVTIIIQDSQNSEDQMSNLNTSKDFDVSFGSTSSGTHSEGSPDQKAAGRSEDCNERKVHVRALI